MTTASLPKPIGVVDHAEVIATFIARSFFSLLWCGWAFAHSCWTLHAYALRFPVKTTDYLHIVIFAGFFFLPIVVAFAPTPSRYRPTAADDVVRWCAVTPIGSMRGALWIGRDALRIVGHGYDERVAFAEITRVEARVQGPFSIRARILGQTYPLVVTKRDGTEVSLIVAAPTSIARSIRRAAALV